MKKCVLCDGELHDESSNVCSKCWSKFQKKEGSSDLVKSASIDKGREFEKPKNTSSDEKIVLEIEKLKGKLELVQGFRGELNERISRIAEEMGDLRRMILDREKSSSNFEANLERLKDMVEGIKPTKIEKNISNILAEIEKNNARVEKTEHLFKGLSSEISEMRDAFVKVKSFENLVDVSSKIQKQLKQAEETKQYSDRLASKVESVFSEMKEKIGLIQKDADLIEKIDSISQTLLKDLDNLKLRFDEETVKEKDVQELKESLKKEYKEIKPEELPKDFLEKINEMEKSLKDLEKSSLSNENIFGEIKNKVEKLDKNFDKKILDIESSLKNKIENLSVNVMGIDELESEKSKIVRLLKAAKLDFDNKTISKRAFNEIQKANGIRLDQINSSLNRVNKEMLFKQVSVLRKEIDKLNERQMGSADKKEFEEIENHLRKISKEMAKVEELKNMQESLNDNIEVLSTRVGDVEEEHLKLKENARKIVGKVISLDAGLEKNRALEEDINKVSQSVNQKMHEIFELRSQIEQLNGQLFQMNKNYTSVLDMFEGLQSKNENLGAILSRLKNQVISIEKNKIGGEDIAKLNKEIEEAMEKNYQIMDALLHKIGA